MAANRFTSVGWPIVPNHYQRSNIDGCSRPGGQQSEVNGSDIIVRVTLMEPPPTPWAIPCHEDVLHVETIVPIGASFTPGQIYRVKVNDLETTAFTSLEPDFPDSYVAPSPIESVEVVTLGGAPPQYELRITSGLPKGSGCSKFSGYEIRRTEPRRSSTGRQVQALTTYAG